MKRTWVAAALVVAATGGLRGAHAQTAQADVALVLAVDVSGSVDDSRFKLQREATAAALESDELAAALSADVNGTIEVAVVEWAEEQSVVVPWTVIRGRSELAAVANRLRLAERSWLHSKTDPAGGIAAADQLFALEPLPAVRRVIDVSGDGRQNSGKVATAASRDAAVAHGATVNGLPIIAEDDPHVDDWYRANVMGGPGAFVIVASGYEAFADAFKQKLTLEVAGLVPKRVLPFASPAMLARIPWHLVREADEPQLAADSSTPTLVTGAYDFVGSAGARPLLAGSVHTEKARWSRVRAPFLNQADRWPNQPVLAVMSR
jgi:hypothetical protein